MLVYFQLRTDYPYHEEDYINMRLGSEEEEIFLVGNVIPGSRSRKAWVLKMDLTTGRLGDSYQEESFDVEVSSGYYIIRLRNGLADPPRSIQTGKPLDAWNTMAHYRPYKYSKVPVDHMSDSFDEVPLPMP